MAGRYYVSTALTTVLSSALGASGNPSVASLPGTWPTNYPFCVLLDWGNSAEEAILVTSAPTGTGPYALPCTRGIDGTTAQAHSAGAQVAHGTTGYEPTLIQENAAAIAALEAGVGGGSVTLAGDLGNTNSDPQVLSTHLTAPLPVNQGGTDSMTQNWQGLLTPTTQTGTYTATPGQLVKANIASASWTLTLPTAPAANAIIGAKIMANATGNTHALTVACGSGDFFEQSGGGTSVTMSLPLQAAAWQYNGGYWTRVSDDLPLGQLSSLYSEKAAVTEYVIYVSASSSASDSNDGLSPGSAKATIAGAKTALGSNAGTIQLGTGTFTLSTADGSGNAASLTEAGTVLRGMGLGLTTISITGTVAWGVVALAQGCTIADMSINIGSGATVTYGCGVSTPGSSGSSEHCKVSNVFVSTAANLTAAFAIGADHAGSGSLDIAWTLLEHCYFNSSATVTNGYLIGNGTTGNVLANTAIACAGGPATYGVTLAGAGIGWYGGGFEATTASDIYISHPSLGDTGLFVGVRSELGCQVLSAGYVGEIGGVTLIDYEAGGFTPTGGSNIIVWNAGGPLTLQGGQYNTTGGTTKFAVNTAPGTPAIAFSARDVITDSANPYPAASAYVQRCILNAQTTNGLTTNPEPIPGFAAVIDNYTPPGMVSTSGEIALSGATSMTSADYGLMHACTVSAAYTVTLPTPVSIAGTQIGVRVKPSSTNLLTLATAAGNIDGSSTRVMWAGESAMLESDGTNWVKIGGKTIPMQGVMALNATQSVASGSVVNVPLTHTYIDNTGLMCDPVTNQYITVQRAANYAVVARVAWASLSALAIRVIVVAYKGGSTPAAQDERYAASGGSPCIGAAGVETFAAGNYCTLSTFQDTGASQTANIGTSAAYGDGTILSLTEIPAW